MPRQARGLLEELDLVGGPRVSQSVDVGHADVIPIAAELVPYLQRAIALSPSELVFPAADGTMMRRDVALEGDRIRGEPMPTTTIPVDGSEAIARVAHSLSKTVPRRKHGACGRSVGIEESQ